MILSSAFCTRWIGAEDPKDKDNPRWMYRIDRFASPVFVGLEAFIFVNIWVAITCGIGFAVWRTPHWNTQFIAMDNNYEGGYLKRRAKLLITKISDWLYPAVNELNVRMYGVLWGGFRGLYDLPAFVLVASLLGNPLAGLIGLGMAAEGLVYYLVGKYIKIDTDPAEWAIGTYRGTLWFTMVILSVYFK